jgi:hypothetical protein
MEELVIEYYEDHFEKHPDEKFSLAGEDVQFKTGDLLIDKWEAELAAGLQPNLDDFFTPEENEELKKRAEDQGFHDDYGLANKEPSVDSKLTPIGSR